MLDPFLSFLDTPTLMKARHVHPRYTHQIKHLMLLRARPRQVKHLNDFLKFQWAYTQGYTLTPRLYLYAAEQGNIDMLKWLDLRMGAASRHKHTCTLAVMHGQFETLRYLRAQNPPFEWDAETCARAVRNNQVEILQWLRAQEPPCPWDWTSCLEGVKTQNYRVLDWLRTQDPPCPWETHEFHPPKLWREPLQWALQFFELKPFEYVPVLKYPCMEYAIREQDLTMIYFLRILGSPNHGLTEFILKRFRILHGNYF
jgi:hypothetical protein